MSALLAFDLTVFLALLGFVKLWQLSRRVTALEKENE